MKARFHLPDFTYNFTVNYLIADMLEKFPGYFYDDVEIASVYDAFPPSVWNGGRLRTGKTDPEYISQVIKAFNDKGIPLRFTFTNLLLEEKHLKDEFCNMVMKMADNGLNEVIVASPILEDYIRETYPNYKITSSICKRINDPELTAAELEKDYHIVVLDYDLNNRFDILEKLPHKEKCELLVCTACQPDCPLRREHFEVVSARNMAYMEHISKSPRNDQTNFRFSDFPKYQRYIDSPSERCTLYSRSYYDVRKLRHYISPEDIREKYMPMGFNQFKLDGRNLQLFNIVEQYMNYMVKPECRAEARYRYLTQLANSNVIKILY